VEASARLVVGRDARGRSVATTLRSEAPLLLRVTGADAGDGSAGECHALQVHLVGGAAGPLCGDRLQFSVAVGAGASLVVRSVAASLAQPGRTGAPGSTATVSAQVASGATLDWWPEPLVSVRGSAHTQNSELSVADETAVVRWVDEVVLGRHDEPAGELTIRQRITVAGRPMLHHVARFDPSTAGIGRHGLGRVIVTGIVLGRPALPSIAAIESDHRMTRYPLAERCTAWVALADSVDVARRALCAAGLARKPFGLSEIQT
jgi:urease accessory protein